MKPGFCPTVSLRAGKWYVSVLTARKVEQPVPQGPAVGIDVGVARFATLPDGSFIAPLTSFKKHEQRLARYQRRMARKVKGSANWKKAKAGIQRINARVAHARADFSPQGFRPHQQKPRNDCRRRPEGPQHVPLPVWNNRRTRAQCPREKWP